MSSATRTSAARKSIFERYPGTTLVLLFVAGFLLLDILIANVLLSTGLMVRPERIESGYRVANPVYHHDLKPLVTEDHSHWGPMSYPVRTNSLGFKDRTARQVSLVPGGRRLVFIGDSFTEGIGIPYEKTFAGIVGSALAADGVEVLNAGVSSYSPIIYRRKIQDLLEHGLRFDSLVVFIDLSDAPNEYLHYKLDERDNVVDRNPQGYRRKLMEWLSANTVFYRFMRERLQDLKQRGRDSRLRDTNGLAINQSRALWTIDQDQYRTMGRIGLERGATHMDALRRLSKEYGFNLAIAVYPWPDQVWYRDRDSVQVRFWRNWAAANGVPFINFFPAFIRDGEDPATVIRRYYFNGDPHWNEAGHALIARGFLGWWRGPARAPAPGDATPPGPARDPQ